MTDNKNDVNQKLNSRMNILQTSRQQQVNRLNRAQQELEAAKNAVIELNGRIGEMQLMGDQLGIKFSPPKQPVQEKKSLKAIASKKVDEEKQKRIQELRKE